MFSSADSRAVSALAALRERVAYLELQNGALRERAQAQEAAHRDELAARDHRTMQYCRQVDALSRNLELVLERGVQLERDLRESTEQREAAARRVAVLVRAAVRVGGRCGDHRLRAHRSATPTRCASS